MKALIYTGEGIALRDVPEPAVNSSDILIEIRSMSICGSDLEFYGAPSLWVKRHSKAGQIIGHEFSGVVVGWGPSATGFACGEAVSAEGHVHCGICETCLEGKEYLCPKTRLIGFDAPGGFAQRISIERRQVRKISPDIDHDLACLHDPVGNVFHAFSRVQGVRGKVVVIVGCGPIGLISIIKARQDKADKVIALDVSDYRLALAVSLGACSAFNVRLCTAADILSGAACESGADILFECSGSPDGVQCGFSLLKPGGRAVLIGLCPEAIPFDFSHHVISRGISIEGITGRSSANWNSLSAFIAEQAARLSRLVTHRLPFEHFAEGFSLMAEQKCGKVVLYNS